MSQSGPFRLDLEDGNVVISRESPNNETKMCHITRGGVRDVVACADIRFIEPMHVSQTYNCDDDEPPCAILSLRGKRATLVFNHWKDLRCLFEEVKDAQRAAKLERFAPPAAARSAVMSQSGLFRLDLADGNIVISRESPHNETKMCHITRGGVRDVVACADIRFIEPMHVSQTYNCDDDEPPCAILSLRGKRATLVFNHWKDLRCLFEEVKDAQRARASLGQGGSKQHTALHAAASSSSPKPCVLQCLLAHSANPNELDADGSTALDLAAAEQQATRDVLRPVTRVCVLAQVAEGSEEWNTVCQRVQETMPQARVTCLELVRNRALLEKHELEKRHMWCRNGKECRLLFHGTKNTPPKYIYNGIDGFDMRFSKKGMWGKALYFAQNSRYSDRYRHTKPDGQFQMFLAEVCIGDYKQLQPDSTLTHPPPTDHDFGANAPERLRYNSVKGHTNGSDVFMVYSNSQAYPKYLITYRHGL